MSKIGVVRKMGRDRCVIWSGYDYPEERLVKERGRDGKKEEKQGQKQAKVRMLKG